MRRLGTLLVITFLVGTLAATDPASAATAQAETRFQQSARTTTNAVRAHHDLPRAGYGSCLQRKAKAQARRMAAARALSHQDLGQVLRDCHLRSAAENVAYGYPTGTATVKRGWMRSAGHRANILNPGYRLMGIGAVRRGGTWYVAQVFGGR